MKNLVWIIAGLLATAVVAALVLRQTKGDPHLREIAFATVITIVSATVALVPLALTPRSSPVAVFQAAFGGTVIHLFLTLGIGAAAHSLGRVDRGLFLFLLLAFYWTSLVFLVIAVTQVVRRSAREFQPPTATAAAPQSKH